MRVRLESGAGSNRSVIGASVRVHVGGWILTRQIAGGMGEGNQNEQTLHFGLADHQDPVKIDVRWPDGKLQTLESVVDQLVVVKRLQ